MMGSGVGAWMAGVPVIGVLGALYAWKGGGASLFLLLLALLIGAVGAASQLCGPTRVTVRRTWAPSAPYEGEEIEVTLQISLEGGIPPLWVQVEDDLAGLEQERGRLLFSGFKRNYSGTYRLSGVARGLYTEGSTTVAWGDVFGWFKRVRRLQGRDKLLVQPLPLYIAAWDEILGRNDGEGGRVDTSLKYAPLWGSRLRAYEPGDPVKSIHWKISARRGELITRAPEEVYAWPACLILDTEPASYFVPERGEIFEIAVSAAAAWLHRQSEGTDAYYFRPGLGNNTLQLIGREGLYEGLEVLAQVQLASERFALSLNGAESWNHLVVPGQRITIITGCLTPSLVARLLQMADAGAVLDVWCSGESGDAAVHGSDVEEAGIGNGGAENWEKSAGNWSAQLSSHGIRMVPLLYDSASVQMKPGRGGRDHGIA
ncbi:DUF58 domain-containing protein [Paenibacillus woosongensis]|uniref:DUF58 domain-containing protein n=1 Tax=Paenibacillus woosongensis TaxID=307580 RepID=A0ABQ4MYN8_9BACL|nr:DUF58 domain-containing protein [Paenibacillus woosongensis]GIP61045.1 hypothetical protein J15TS10_48590 [Paenibacillus woosongensis]